MFSVPYITVRGMSIFFFTSSSQRGWRIGSNLSSPVAGLFFDSRKMLLLSGLKDTMVGFESCSELHINCCDLMVAVAVAAT